MTGEGEGTEGNPTILKNAASDWCGASSVDYLALETSIKPGMLCLRASQVWSHLICGRRLEIIQNRGFTAVRELILISVFLNFVLVFGYGNAGGGGYSLKTG